jgi:hypothetical protein
MPRLQERTYHQPQELTVLTPDLLKNFGYISLSPCLGMLTVVLNVAILLEVFELQYLNLFQKRATALTLINGDQFHY